MPLDVLRDHPSEIFEHLTDGVVTDTCAMGTALSKLRYNRGAASDLDSIVAELSTC